MYYVRKRQLGFLGHILRLPKEAPARRYAFYAPPRGKRKPGRSHTFYITFIQRVLGYHEADISADEIATLADLCPWRNLVNYLLRSRRMLMMMCTWEKQSQKLEYVKVT